MNPHLNALSGPKSLETSPTAIRKNNDSSGTAPLDPTVGRKSSRA